MRSPFRFDGGLFELFALDRTSIFFGQIEILLTVIVQGAFAAGAQTRESDKYLGFMLIISFMFSIIMPLNTTVLENYVTVSYGFKGLFDAIRAAFTVSTFLIFLLSAKVKNRPTTKKPPSIF